MSDQDPRLEHVARLLCRIEGKDENRLFQTKDIGTFRRGNTLETGPKEVPFWQTKLEEARKFVAVFDALKATR
jgi:hypothetical protein